ncbi:MAG TPA: GNAT family N-acetyltransferase [Candidatus Lustribacter sp.]|nr:GNAT family N-acetyltransferase [Candidatus Lustribacter sp.]
MTEIDVRRLSEDDWQDYRAVRLDALRESPDAFVATHAEESALDEAHWRDRLRRSVRLVASVEAKDIGVVSVGRAGHTGDGFSDADGAVGELFGLWVHPSLRGQGVAMQLVNEGAAQARDAGSTHLCYWVGTDNGPAVAFASGIGFRPTDHRRPMRGAAHEDEEEIAMILPLGADRG